MSFVPWSLMNGNAPAAAWTLANPKIAVLVLRKDSERSLPPAKGSIESFP